MVSISAASRSRLLPFIAEEDGGKFSLIDTDSVTRDHEIFFPADYDDANRDRLPDNHFTYPSDDDLEEWGLSWSHARALAEMNDTGSSFSEIADCIQEILTSSDEQAETAQTSGRTYVELDFEPERMRITDPPANYYEPFAAA